jgi:hypothetical protein
VRVCECAACCDCMYERVCVIGRGTIRLSVMSTFGNMPETWAKGKAQPVHGKPIQ